MSYTCTTTLTINPTATATVTAIMGTPCPPPTHETLGLFGSAWANISGFFGTIWSTITTCLGFAFGSVLPVGIAVAVLFAIGCAVYGFVTVFAASYSWSEFHRRLREIERERKEKLLGDVKGLLNEGEMDICLDGEVVDVLDEKIRVRVEIEFLEVLLRAKREKFESL
ncbi:hypothetical protein BJX63DRAFT_415134 [Aspergillus granulosus]|uniref:Uncharacterized protein n=1 Tax=Aspergillus granulosus TaxID=176169 RepID=A0ABR4GTK8_9EURO